MGRLVVEISEPLQRGFLDVYAQINFLHLAVILFTISTAVLCRTERNRGHAPAGSVRLFLPGTVWSHQNSRRRKWR